MTGAAYNLQPALISVTLQHGTGTAEAGQMYTHIRVFDGKGHLITERVRGLIPDNR